MIDDTIAWYENDGAVNPTFTKIFITSADGARRCTCCRFGWRWRFRYSFCFCRMTIQLPGMKMMEQQIQHLLQQCIATSADGAMTFMLQI